MRLIALTLALAAPLAAQAQTTPAPAPAPAQSGWTSFSPPEGHYSVLLPTAPKRQEDVTPDGPAKGAKNVIYFSLAAPTIYMIAWSDYPSAITVDPQAEIDANRDNFIKGLGATLSSSTAHMLGSNKGIEFTATRPEQASAPGGQSQPALSIRGRVYMHGRRPVMTAVVTNAANAGSADAARFLDSFRFK